MPVFSEQKPYGYCQATGQNEKKIRAFLKRIGAKPTDRICRKTKGKPKDVYDFGTNMRVLNQWLSQWTLQSPDLLADIVADTLVLASLQRSSDKQALTLRRGLGRHWKRVINEVVSPDLKKESKEWIEKLLFGSPSDWRAWIKQGSECRNMLKSDRAFRRPINPYDPKPGST